LREIGYEIWVCDSSRVIHHEGLSHGASAIVLANTNRGKFFAKWETELIAHHKHSSDPNHLQKAAMRHTQYADSEIISNLTELLWGSENQI